MTVEKFLRFHLKRVAGHAVPLVAIRRLYAEALPGYRTPEHNRVAFSRALHAAGYQTAVGNGNVTFIVNVSLDPTARPSKPLSLHTGKATARQHITK